MADSPEEKFGIEERRRWIKEEAQKQVEPLKKAVAILEEQGRTQNALLSMQVQKITEVGNRLRGLWGNGSGPPGYLETAREEDEKWKEKVFNKLHAIEAERYREEGEKRLLAEQEDGKNRKLGRLKLYLAILGCFGGSWVLSLVHPYLLALLDHAEKALR